MAIFLPTKSSSRAGRFKKKLVDEAFLAEEAPVIEAKMAPFLELYRNDKLHASELVGLYVLTVLAYRFPGGWLGSKRPPLAIAHQMNFPLEKLSFEPNIQKRLASFKTIGEVFAHFALKSTPETVNRALLSWSEGSYGLELMFRIPQPHEVLHQQKQGRRVVTLLTDKKRTQHFILGERDSLSFTMHDLIHADHFYHKNECFKGQLGFYGFLDHCMKENHFESHLTNEKFASEFEYLIADMNAYAIHLFKCLKSALIFFHPEGENFYQEWSQKLTQDTQEIEALDLLNTSSFSSRHDEILLQFLNKWNGLANLTP